MFTRIVKMEFKKEKIPTFLINFEKVKEKIRAFEGCSYLELYQDKNNTETFFTYSRWENDADKSYCQNYCDKDPADSNANARGDSEFEKGKDKKQQGYVS